MDERWRQVDEQLEAAVLTDDAALTEALDRSARAGLPAIAVSPLQGKLLHLLARAHGARRVLEIGTLGGYSTIWLARSVPDDGEVVTLELSQHHADVAAENLRRAGVADRVRVVVGPAAQSLARLDGPFDLLFVDADKRSSPSYVEAALRLMPAGAVVVVDNVVRRAASDDLADPDVAGTHALLRLLREHPRLDATVVQTVGSKGWDGFALAVVGEED